MLQIEPGRDLRLPDQFPDRLQGILNRLQKRYKNFSEEERRLLIIAEIENMNLTAAERKEILRRLQHKRPAYMRGH
jgi:hypothetical protein